MPIRRLRLKADGSCYRKPEAKCRAEMFQKNSLHISSLRVSLHSMPSVSGRNSRGQVHIRSKPGICRLTAQLHWAWEAAVLFFTNTFSHVNFSESSPDALSMAHTPCLGRFLPVFPPPLLLTAPLCPGNLGHTSGSQYLVRHPSVSSSFCPLPPLSVFAYLSAEPFSLMVLGENCPTPLS